MCTGVIEERLNNVNIHQKVILFDPCQQLKRWDQVELMVQIMNTVPDIVVLFKHMLIAKHRINVTISEFLK